MDTGLLQALLSQAAPADPAVHEGGVAFTKLFLRYESMMITAASWVIIQVVQKTLTVVGNHKLFIRFKPAMPVVISVGMAYMPSFRIGSWDETLLYGIILGSMTGFGQKVLKQTLLGQDSRLEEKEPEPAAPAPPALPAAPEVRRKRIREKIKHLIT